MVNTANKASGAKVDNAESRVPKHIAIVMDGNRRFSKRLMMKPWKGHEWGAKKVEQVLEWCEELGVKELTLYAFSVENFNRPKEEFDYLMGLFEREFNRIKDDPKIMKKGLRIHFIGRLWMFPKKVQESMKALAEKTKFNDRTQVNFAMAYGGRAEVIDAVKKIASKVASGEMGVEEVNESSFSKNLYFEGEPELIIRTGGDMRTSNFLMWQANYSEWYFCEKLWPEFEKKDFVLAVEDYKERERRFGR